MITHAQLKELLHYDPDTGIFTRLVRNANNTKVGDVAGTEEKSGYIRIRVSGGHYYAHRLVFLYITGSFPPQHTDHINGIKNDNRWSNLRAVTPSENHRNKKLPSTNKSGVMGVSWSGYAGKWVVSMRCRSTPLYIGIFDDFFEAVCARKSAETNYNFHPNHGR